MDNLQKLKNYLDGVLDVPTIKKWIEPLKYIGTLEKTLFLGAPDRKNLQWVRQNLLEDIKPAAIGEHQVDDGGNECVLAEQLGGFLAAGGPNGVIAAARERLLRDGADALIIIDNKYPDLLAVHVRSLH